MSDFNKKRSPLWDHFSVLDKKAKCSYCGQLLSIPSGNLGNLKRHLKSQHPTVPIIAERQTLQVTEPTAVEEVQEPGTSYSNRPLVTFATSHVSASLRVGTVRDYLTSVKPLPPHRTKMLDEQLLKMIAKEYHPLRLVEEKEFRKFWKINNKITAIASDNAANITSAIREGNWRLIACFAHSINLLVKDALIHISETTTKIKTIVEYFKRSSHAQQELNKLQASMNLPQLKLKQDVATRWNSTYDMLSRFLQCKSAITATVALLRSDLCLNDNDWKVVEEIVPIFSLFAEMTNEISAEKSVTLSKVLPMCRIIYINISNRLRETDHTTLPAISTVLQTLNSQFNKRFGTIENNAIYCEATILDPRFKNKRFRDQEKFEKALGCLKSKVALSQPLVPERAPILAPQHPVPTTSSSKKFWDDFDSEIVILTPQNPTAAGIVEVDKYLNEIFLERKRDPLKWWHERRLVYPLLYQFMLKRLNLIATSVPCERIFSKAGYTLNERRTRLTTKKLSQLLFINSNTEKVVNQVGIPAYLPFDNIKIIVHRN
ncbi:unnamed protein product [Arctia plantaginis]|uniref:BED-type domain-containing protein n=1 Tax=Arctia plantaginis TaxID=874455 RepID=A0A8S1A6W3_ARCPL|nr:unnamed protein product [Arctia plantaginis]